MTQRTVKFTHSGHSHLVGNFVAGDCYTGDAEHCRHFVEDAQCAEWAQPKVQASAPAPVIKATKATKAKVKGA